MAYVTSDYAGRLQARLRSHANPDLAGPMQDYMRGQFAFLGIKSPERAALVRQFLQENGVPEDGELEKVVRELWAQPEREFQYAALTLLGKRSKTADASRIELLEELITTKSWWDTVDELAGHAVGELFTRFPGLIPVRTQRWMASNSMWLQRTALLFQLRYKERTDAALLFDLIRQCADSKEFFIRKAIGWALREYSKTDEAAVRRFVAETALSPLSIREALKYADRRKPQ